MSQITPQFWIKQEMKNITLTWPVSESVLTPAAGSSLLIENKFQVSQKAWPRHLQHDWNNSTGRGGTCANNVHLGIRSLLMHFNGGFFQWRVSSFILSLVECRSSSHFSTHPEDQRTRFFPHRTRSDPFACGLRISIGNEWLPVISQLDSSASGKAA